MEPKLGIRRKDFSSQKEYMRAYGIAYKKWMVENCIEYRYDKKSKHDKRFDERGLSFIFKGSAIRYGFTRIELLQMTQGERINCAGRSYLYHKFGAKCNLCFSNISFPNEYHIDHIVPLIFGGDDSLSNNQCICVNCHREKTNKELESFYGGPKLNAKKKKLYRTDYDGSFIFNKKW